MWWRTASAAHNSDSRCTAEAKYLWLMGKKGLALPCGNYIRRLFITQHRTPSDSHDNEHDIALQSYESSCYIYGCLLTMEFHSSCSCRHTGEAYIVFQTKQMNGFSRLYISDKTEQLHANWTIVKANKIGNSNSDSHKVGQKRILSLDCGNHFVLNNHELHVFNSKCDANGLPKS